MRDGQPKSATYIAVKAGAFRPARQPLAGRREPPDRWLSAIRTGFERVFGTPKRSWGRHRVRGRSPDSNAAYLPLLSIAVDVHRASVFAA